MSNKILISWHKTGEHSAEGADDGNPVTERGAEAGGGDPARAAEGVRRAEPGGAGAEAAGAAVPGAASDAGDQQLRAADAPEAGPAEQLHARAIQPRRLLTLGRIGNPLN